MSDALLAFTENKLENTHFRQELEIIRVEVERSFHFEDIINFGIMSGWIDSSWL